MEYSLAQKSRIKSLAIAKLVEQFDQACEDNTIDEFIEQYNVYFDEDPMPVYVRTSKILVLGVLAGNVNDYLLAAKKLGVSSNNIEFVSDYDEIKTYNVTKLENSLVYSDIICGPMPHKVEGLEDDSSFIATLRKHPNSYPRAQVATANGVIKLSKESFKRAIINTRYYENL